MSFSAPDEHHGHPWDSTTRDFLHHDGKKKTRHKHRLKTEKIKAPGSAALLSMAKIAAEARGGTHPGHEMLGLQQRVLQLDALCRRMEESTEERFSKHDKQLRKTREAFDALSDAVLEEIDVLREETNERWEIIEARLDKSDTKMKRIVKKVEDFLSPAGREVEHTVLDTLAKELENVRKDAVKIYQTNTRLDIMEQKYVAVSGKLEATSTLSANADRWVREVKEDMLQMRDDIDKSRDGITGAAGALAQDIAALADDAAIMRDEHSKLKGETQKRLVALAEIIEAQHEADSVSYENRFVDLEKEVRDNNDSIRDALRVALKQQHRLRATVSDGFGNMGKEISATAAHSKRLEDDVRREILRLQDERDLTRTDVQAQFEAMSTALNAFADLLQVNLKGGHDSGVRPSQNQGLQQQAVVHNMMRTSIGGGGHPSSIGNVIDQMASAQAL
jgi:hypothetical protein|eukprot:Stramenopile-MAST_4_protein_349